MPEVVEKSGGDQVYNPFASILPLLMSLPMSAEPKDGLTTKPTRYLIATGLPTIPMKTVEKAWNLEYVEMEEFLPAPRSLQLAEQVKPTGSLQESLVGGLQPVPGFPAAQGAASSTGYYDMG